MWIVLALMAALGDALRDTSTKKFAGSVSPLLISWSYSLFMLPFLAPLLIMAWPESIAGIFWPLITIVASLHVLGGIVLVRALHAGDLSLSAPLTAFTPVFLLITGPLITGDSVSTIGILGACLVVSGSYLLNLSKAKAGPLGPILALTRQPGARNMLFLAFLWSITGSIDRLALKSIPLSFWGPAQAFAIALFFLPVAVTRANWRSIFEGPTFRRLLIIGGTNALSFIPYLFALHMAPVYYVVCVKRTSILLSIPLGRSVFGEDTLGERLVGASCMLLGVVIISFWG